MLLELINIYVVSGLHKIKKKLLIGRSLLKIREKYCTYQEQNWKNILHYWHNGRNEKNQCEREIEFRSDRAESGVGISRGERTNIINFLSVFILVLRNCTTKFNCVARQWAQNKAIIVRTAWLKLHRTRE